MGQSIHAFVSANAVVLPRAREPSSRSREPTWTARPEHCGSCRGVGRVGVVLVELLQEQVLHSQVAHIGASEINEQLNDLRNEMGGVMMCAGKDVHG